MKLHTYAVFRRRGGLRERDLPCGSWSVSQGRIKFRTALVWTSVPRASSTLSTPSTSSRVRTPTASSSRRERAWTLAPMVAKGSPSTARAQSIQLLGSSSGAPTSTSRASNQRVRTILRWTTRPHPQKPPRRIPRCLTSAAAAPAVAPTMMAVPRPAESPQVAEVGRSGVESSSRLSRLPNPQRMESSNRIPCELGRPEG